MADYVIRKKPGFTFAMEIDPENVYTIPAMGDLSVDDVVMFNKVATNGDVKAKCLECKAFILRHAPELEHEAIGDMEFVNIFTAYAQAQAATNGKKLGES